LKEISSTTTISPPRAECCPWQLKRPKKYPVLRGYYKRNACTQG